MKKHIIKNPFLDEYEFCFLYWPLTELKKYCNNYLWLNEIIPDNFNAVHYFNWFKSCILIFDFTEEKEAAIIHEITHWVQRMLFFLWIEWDFRNTELVANLMQYYILEWLKFYNKVIPLKWN